MAEPSTPTEGAPEEIPEEIPREPGGKKGAWWKIVAVIVVIVVIISVLAIVYLLPSNQPGTPGTNQPPSITQLAASAESTDVNKPVTFTAQATDPDNDALSYVWNFGDGTTATGNFTSGQASVSHTYTLPGNFIDLLTVSDGHNHNVTNDGNLLFVQSKLAASSVAAPSDCPSGATKNAGFTSDASSWTYATWQGTSADSFGEFSAIGGNTGGATDGRVNITMNYTASSTISGYWYQPFAYDGSTPFQARLHLGWNVTDFEATGGNTTLYAFVDSSSGAPTIGQQVWTSGLQTANSTAWTNVTGINVNAKLTASGTYYVKLAAVTQFATSGAATQVGFDNAGLTWSATGCPPGAVVATLSANSATVQTGTSISFTGNASWAYAFTWNKASDHSQGGTYPVVTAADDDTLFTSLAYNWGDGSAATSGTSDAVGETTHTFSTPGIYFVKLTVTYSNAGLGLDVAASTVTAVSGYSVRVLAQAPTTQVKYPDIFTEVTIGEPQYLDPAVDYETAGGEVLQSTYETLVWYNEGSSSLTDIVPRLATDVPSTTNGGISADGMNYTFNLRQNVTFHDGSHMTANDVAYSIRRVLAIHDPNGPSWMLEQFLTNYVSYATGDQCGTNGDQQCYVSDWVSSPSDVSQAILGVIGAPSTWATEPITESLAWAISNASVEVTGQYQVVFHLTHPYPAFLQVMAFTAASVMSQACVNANGGLQWGQHNQNLDLGTVDCGSGPYKISSWVPNQVIILTRFDSYWRTPAAIKEVHIAKANDIATRELMLFSGDADTAYVGWNYKNDVLAADGNTPKYNYLSVTKGLPTLDVDFIGFDQSINPAYAPDPLAGLPTDFFANLHVRKAFSYAFDYNTYINQVLYGGAARLNGAIANGLLGYNPNIPLFPFDLSKAAAEFQQTPYWTAGFNITLYWNSGNDARQTAALLLRSGLTALNSAPYNMPGHITVDTRALDWPVYLTALRHHGLPVFVLGWAPDYADPDDYATPFLHTGGTYPLWMGYSNTTLDGLLDAASVELNQTVRAQMYQSLTYNASVYDVPYIWLDQATNFHVERTWVHGWFFNSMLSGIYFYTLSKS